MLETEFDNAAALALYESLGFVREKRLFRFYLNGKDAFRLVLVVAPLPDDGGGSEPKLDNKALDSVVNASDEKGGTLKMGLGGAWGDSFDPGDTYYGYSWDLGRNYWRTLVMNKTAPGKQGL